MYIVQTVSSRPRPWSSYTNVSAKNEEYKINSMNSVEELSRYRDSKIGYKSPTLQRRTLAATTYDFPENPTPTPTKKDKKWTLGSLFRRKKKDETESSSDEDNKKNFLNRRKRKNDKKRKKLVGTFDHVVLPQNNRVSQSANGYDDSGGMLSDPSGGFASYINRPLPRVPMPAEVSFNSRIRSSKEKLERNDNNLSRNSLGSADSLSKKGRKGRAKARAAARRENFGSSSDDDSQISTSSARFRSDENIVRHRDGSLSRRSRTARTERYIRRLSREEENILNKEAKQEQSKPSRPDAEPNVERCTRRWKTTEERNPNENYNHILSANQKNRNSFSISPPINANFNGLSTIPPSHNSFKNHNNNSMKTPQQYQLHDQIHGITKYASLEMNPIFDCINKRSFSYDAHINHTSYDNDGVLHVQLPVRKPSQRQRHLTMVEQPRFVNYDRQPPPPPPRDPRRLTQPIETNKSSTYAFDKFIQLKNPASKPVTSNALSTSSNKLVDLNKSKSLNWHPGYRSTSEDHIPRDLPQSQTIQRPSSVTPETSRSAQRYMTRQPVSLDSQDNFQYLTDKNPRSRRPIFIKSGSKVDKSSPEKQEDSMKKALDFWMQKDLEEISKSQERLMRKSTSYSPQMFTAQTHVRTNIFLPSVVRSDVDNSLLYADTVDAAPRESSPFKPISPTSKSCDSNSTSSSLDNKYRSNTDAKITKPSTIEKMKDEKEERKSTNLEDALDELEAIYQSLHLGDEDLLERAEQREIEMTAAAKATEPYPSWVMSRGALSDSSFSYEPFDLVDSPRRKRLQKKLRNDDRKTDDMAYRKYNKERANTINDPQSVISKVSYLLASPVINGEDEIQQESPINGKEPDVTLDDVVYRNIKHTNNTLKVAEPQPPFGIPLGPITVAANSDYLHAVPENTSRYSFKARKYPDIVKDDLAYRNLRKDSNKVPNLPTSMCEDYIKNSNVNPESKIDFNALKKNRAVRSLSANISNLIQKDRRIRAESPTNPFEKELDKSDLSDIAEALEMAKKILKEKDCKITNTKRAFLSDTDAKYNNYFSPATNNSKTNFMNQMRSTSPEDSCSVQQKLQVYIPLLNDEYLDSKPPRGSTPDRRQAKESTPIPIARTEIKDKNETYHSSLEELLNALEVEAKETSEKISNELKDLEKLHALDKDNTTNLEENTNKLNKQIGIEDIDEVDHVKSTKQVSVLADLNKTLSDIDSVSEHAKLCKKLLECVVESTDLISSVKTEAFKEEQVETLDPSVPESVVNVVVTTEPARESPENAVVLELHSEPDYENILSEDDTKDPKIDDYTMEDKPSKSPFEEHKAELIAGFQELKLIKDLTTTQKNITLESTEMKIGTKQTVVPEVGGEDAKDDVGGEHSVLKCEALPFNSDRHVFDVNNKHNDIGQPVYVSSCEIILNGDVDLELAESERSSGFHSISYENSIHDAGENESLSDVDEGTFDLSNSLKSPKLVLQSALKLEEFRNSQENLLDKFKVDIDFNQLFNSNLYDIDPCSSKSVVTSESGIESVSLFVSDLNLSVDDCDDDRAELNVENMFRSKLDFSDNENSHYELVTRNESSAESVINCEEIRLQTEENHTIFDETSSDVEYYTICKEFIEEDISSDSESLYYECSSEKKFNIKHQTDPCSSFSQLETSRNVLKNKANDKKQEKNSNALRDTRGLNDQTHKDKSSNTWYRDPLMLAIACVYGFACTYQLASLDAVAIIGLIFVILSFFAAIII